MKRTTELDARTDRSSGSPEGAAQLRAERERLAVTLGSLVEAVLAADADGRVTLLNPAAEALTGWAAAEAVGRPAHEVLRLVDEDSGRAVGSPVDRVLRRGTDVAVAARIALVARDGARRPVSERAAAIRDDAGRVCGAVVVLRDETAQRRTERLYRARVELLEYAQSHTLPEVMQRTLDLLEELTGSLIGFYHFVEPDGRTLLLQVWSTRTRREFCRAEGAGEHRLLTAAGVWVDCARERRPVIHNDYASLPHRRGLPPGHAAVVRELAVPVFREDRVVAILGVGNKPTDYVDEDVEAVSYLADACWETTARKRAEEVRDALEAQLRQAQKLESIGRLAGGVAHDFNNLLTVILSCSTSLEQAVKAGGPADLEEILEIRLAGERARDLTRRLLAFARKQASVPARLDLGAALHGVEGLLRRVLGDDVALRVLVPEGTWPVLLDPGLLEQLVLNLAVNARDAMPGGGILTLEARNAAVTAAGLRPGERPGDWVRLLVRDTGAGMTPEVQAHVFEPFFTTKAPGQGTGLGLATVHGIVTQAGGHVRVESAPGQGTTIEVWLPRLAGEEAAPPPAPAPAPGPDRAGRETVLVVEDEPLVRAVLARHLRDAGYRVLQATHGADALAQAEAFAEPIDLLVSDVQMPGQDGPTLAAALRRLRPGLRALLVSGFIPEDSEAARAGDGFLAKPFGRSSLLAKVREVLDAPAREG